MAITIKKVSKTWLEDGVWYAPDWQENQDPVRELAHLTKEAETRDLSTGEQRRVEELREIMPKLCWVLLFPYTAGEYQRVRAKSTHLSIKVKIERSRDSAMVKGDQDAREAAFAADAIREQMRGAQNLMLEIDEAGNPVFIDNNEHAGKKMMEAITGSDDDSWGLALDIFKAIKEMSHLERGRKKA